MTPSKGISISGKKHKKRYWALTLMALPALIYFFINNYMPMFYMFIAFKKINWKLGLFGSPWVGLDNFKFLFNTPDAGLMTRNTIIYNLIFISLGPVLAITLAVLLSEIGSKRMRALYQSTFIVPSMVSMTVVGYVIYALLNPSIGFVNTLLRTFGIDGPSWYTQPKYWPGILIFTNMWKNIGYSSIIYLATIVGINKSLYEAAYIDGAGRWQRVWYITLPMLRAVFITMFLLSVGSIFYSDFGLFYQATMASGPLKSVTMVIDVYVYKMLILQGDIAKSSAAGFYQSMVGLVMVIIANLIVRRIDPDSALF